MPKYVMPFFHLPTVNALGMKLSYTPDTFIKAIVRASEKYGDNGLFVYDSKEQAAQMIDVGDWVFEVELDENARNPAIEYSVEAKLQKIKLSDIKTFKFACLRKSETNWTPYGGKLESTWEERKGFYAHFRALHAAVDRLETQNPKRKAVRHFLSIMEELATDGDESFAKLNALMAATLTLVQEPNPSAETIRTYEALAKRQQSSYSLIMQALAVSMLALAAIVVAAATSSLVLPLSLGLASCSLFGLSRRQNEVSNTMFEISAEVATLRGP